MKLLLVLLRKSSRLALLTVLFGLLSGACSTWLVALINQVLARGTEGSLEGIALPFAGLAVAGLLTRMGSQLALNRLQQGILLELRLWLSRHLLSTSQRKLEEAGAHRMLGSLMQDLQTLSAGVMVLPELFIGGAVVLSCLLYLGWLSWPLFLAVLGLLVVGQLTYALPAGAANRYQQEAREQTHTLLRHFVAMFNGGKELRLNRSRRRAFYDQDLAPSAHEVRRLFLRSDDLFSIASSWGMSLYTATIGLLLLVGPRFTTLSQGELIGAVLVVLFLQQPLSVITNLFPSVRRAEVALAQIEKLGLSLTTEQGTAGTALPEDTREPPRTFERLELVGVTHVYRNERDGEQFTLGPIDLSLRRGELLFLVGGNGSGKTTLAKVLCGLYTAESGELRVDGRSVTSEGLDDYRQLFSAVFFDFFLFERLLGLSSPEMLRQARDYLERLHLDKKVQVNEAGALSTVALSQGQRKRLALMVAYLEDRPVYLFDEWAADQDPQFKEVFYKQLLPDLKARGKAVVVISHDDRYFHLADRLVRIESGQLVNPDTAQARGVVGA
ncbi:cyclic peptide export ABC transporter [Myxococcus sp. RHSTA-1-4]|uniref:cyclic peptide export ABC transporter n=1 Tax=Myxococcus sp. RHSTA-1-4 TaxID=2874601 RepID=UPI001CBACB33|nr:cyclic peptide export ABC transporter [Myxococcus sp. RHSTA-1-4]MBZ4423314.1 cyclic peptide export ABC transporter [Myxococcus sp. RHSTA-1-4]